MKLIEYVSKYKDGWTKRSPRKVRPSCLHGEDFYTWFDKEYSLHPIPETPV